jgi:signal transduction histidine kinase
LAEPAAKNTLQNDLTMLARLWPEPLLILDGNDIIVAVSNAAETAIQWSASKLVGQSAHQLLCAETYDQRHADKDCPMRSGVGETRASVYWISGEDSHISVDFRVLPAPVDGFRLLVFRVLGAGEYSRTELKTLARLCEVTPAPLLEITSEGLILFANPAMTALMVQYGFDVSGAAEILPDNLAHLAKTCIAENRSLLDLEKNLRDRCFLWQMYPFQQEDFQTVLVTGSDLTEQRQAARQARISERQLLIERDRIRRDYVAKMVHDLRSPLNAITGFGSLLRSSLGPKLSSQERELLEDMLQGAQDLSRQINESLTQARIDAAQIPVKLQPVHLDVLIRSLTRNLAALAQQKSLRLITGASELEVTADPQLLTQALTNLVANAIKFTEKGHISIEITQLDALNYRIVVADTGCGIAADALKTIFEPYARQRQHEANVEGQGLGLAIVNDIVKLHGGSVSVESRIAEGTRFTLRLPLIP